MVMLIDLSAAISIANTILLSVIIVTYIKIYHSTKASFTIGLIFFASMLLLHNVIAVYAYFMMAPLYSEELLPYFVAIHIAELAGIISLLKITLS